MYVCTGPSRLNLSTNDKRQQGKSTVGEWVRREDWIDDRYVVQPWRMQGKKKRVPVGVVTCLDLSCPGYAVLCCACSVGRSAWAIWFQFGPVQIQARPSLPNDGASTGQCKARHGGCRLLFCGAGFPPMLRCRFDGTFTEPVKVVGLQVTSNPPTNNPAARRLQPGPGSLSSAADFIGDLRARKTQTGLGRHAHAWRTHHLLSLTAEF